MFRRDDQIKCHCQQMFLSNTFIPQIPVSLGIKLEETESQVYYTDRLINNHVNNYP